MTQKVLKRCAAVLRDARYQVRNSRFQVLDSSVFIVPKCYRTL